VSDTHNFPLFAGSIFRVAMIQIQTPAAGMRITRAC